MTKRLRHTGSTLPELFIITAKRGQEAYVTCVSAIERIAREITKLGLTDARIDHWQLIHPGGSHHQTIPPEWKRKAQFPWH